MYCNLVALYFCTGTVCLTKDTLLAHLGARAKRKIAKLGFSLGQLAAVVQNAGTPYRITEAPQLHGDLLGIITQQDHQVVAYAAVCLCLLHPHPFPPSQVLFGVEGTYRGKPAFHCCAYCPFRGECGHLCFFSVDSGVCRAVVHQAEAGAAGGSTAPHCGGRAAADAAVRVSGVFVCACMTLICVCVQNQGCD